MIALFAAAAAVAAGMAAGPAATPVPSPIAIEQCASEQQSTTNPNLKVGVAFRNLAASAAVHVEFDIQLVDSGGAPVADHVVSIDGTFEPDQLIDPRRSSITGGVLTQPEYPDSPAWNVANHFGSGAQSVRCAVRSARFADGSAWSALF